MQSSSQISVIICTHNPREDYLRRTLDALKAQTLPKEQWELLLIDNASKEILSAKWDLTWHLNACHIREDELGLTPARLRGIKESKGELLVFVDDDNVLDCNYLECTFRIAKEFPFLGAWGGSCVGEFEESPGQELTDFLPYLALRKVSVARWSNYDEHSLPLGAGMSIRAAVAHRYLSEAKSASMRKLLGRRGKSLLGGEDYDLGMSCYALGLGTGIFPHLCLCHLIPQRRINYEYLYRLCVASCYSVRIAKYFHFSENVSPRHHRSRKVESFVAAARQIILREKVSDHEKAAKAGIRMAEEDIIRLQHGKPLFWIESL